MNDMAVVDVVWDILQRPHHRVRCERWARTGAAPQLSIAGRSGGGSQSCIAWVVEAHLDGEDSARSAWSVPDSSPRRRSAIQRFFSQGASRWTRIGAGPQPIEKLTRSRALIDIVNAFGFSAAELAEVRSAWTAALPDETWHMGRHHHSWDTARTDDDLRDVVELSRRLIGGQADFGLPGDPPTEADIAPLRRRLDLRADALELCLRHALGEPYETLVGYILIYPLDASGTADILAGRALSAADLDDSQVATTFAAEDSLYIGMVLGSDLSARVSVMERCIARVSKWTAPHPDGWVLAKRSTGDGERWLSSYDFVPVSDRDGIWMRDPSLAPSDRRRGRRRRIASIA
jgi:hypothetical protein